MLYSQLNNENTIESEWIGEGMGNFRLLFSQCVAQSIFVLIA